MIDPTVLTEREHQVYELLAAGLCVKEIAGKLGCATKTAECHRYHVYRKLGVAHQAQLIAKFYQQFITNYFPA